MVDERALNRRADLQAGDFLVALSTEIESLHGLGSDVAEACHGEWSVRLSIVRGWWVTFG